MVIRIILPYPDKKLSPNSRGHFYKNAAAKATARQSAYYLCINYKNTFNATNRLFLDIKVYKKEKSHYDLDNTLASCKALFDGVFDALGVNDNQVDKITIARAGVDKIKPRIELEIGVING